MILMTRLSSYEWPVGHRWSVLTDCIQELRKYTLQYAVEVLEMTSSRHPSRHEFELFRWNRDPSVGSASKREILGVYKDIDAVIGVLKMLIANEKEKLDGVHK